jgi:hypothetical protein
MCHIGRTAISLLQHSILKDKSGPMGAAVGVIIAGVKDSSNIRTLNRPTLIFLLYNLLKVFYIL